MRGRFSDLRPPLLWRLLAGVRGYVMPIYLAIGFMLSSTWLTLEVVATRGTSISPSGEIFLGGFGILMALVFAGSAALAVAIEDTVKRTLEDIAVQRREDTNRLFADISELVRTSALEIERDVRRSMAEQRESEDEE